MSRKLTMLIVGIAASLALAAGTMQGCGSSSSGSDNVALCQMACDKALACTPDAGPDEQAAAMTCRNGCPAQVANVHCSNEAAIATAFRGCLSMECSAYLSCLTTVPA